MHYRRFSDKERAAFAARGYDKAELVVRDVTDYPALPDKRGAIGHFIVFCVFSSLLRRRIFRLRTGRFPETAAQATQPDNMNM